MLNSSGWMDAYGPFDVALVAASVVNKGNESVTSRRRRHSAVQIVFRGKVGADGADET